MHNGTGDLKNPKVIFKQIYLDIVRGKTLMKLIKKTINLYSGIFAIFIIILNFATVLFFYGESASAKDLNSGYILPKTFKINDKYLPPLNSTPPSNPAKGETSTITVIKGNQKTTVKTPKAITTRTSHTSSTPPKESNVTLKPVKTPQSQNITKTPATTPAKPFITSVSSPKTVSLTSLVRKYDLAYPEAFRSAVLALSDMQIPAENFNSATGQIVFRLKNRKEFFMLIAPFEQNASFIRITPADGDYAVSLESLDQIFSAISAYSSFSAASANISTGSIN